jgi:fluoroquinolone resistance protein
VSDRGGGVHHAWVDGCWSAGWPWVRYSRPPDSPCERSRLPSTPEHPEALRFVDRNLEHHDFHQAALQDAHFEKCRLAGANFRGAELAGASFERCQLFEPDVEGADFAFADLREAQFSHCDLTTASFQHCRAYGLVFSHCQAQGVDLSNADFALPIGGSATSGLALFTMDQCNFAYGDLSNTFLKACTLTNNRMIEALLHNTILDDACFTGSDLSNVSGKGMSLAGADLRGASFNNLDPRQLDLTGVRITPDQALLLLAPLGVAVDMPDAGDQ